MKAKQESSRKQRTRNASRNKKPAGTSKAKKTTKRKILFTGSAMPEGRKFDVRMD